MTPLIPQFDLLATAPGGVARLRELILTLAVQGKLVPQEAGDKPASVLLQRIRAEKNKRDKTFSTPDEDEIPFELPFSWEWSRFGTIANIASNLVSPTAFGSAWQVAPDCIEKGTGRLIHKRTVAEAEITSSNHRFVPGQILYSKIRPSLSKAVVVDFPGLCSADMYPIDSKLNTSFLHLYILSRPFLDQVMVAENRVKMPKLNQEALTSFVVPVPPLAEQSRIVTRVEELMRLCDALEQQRQLETAQHAQLLNTLLGTLTDCTSPDELAAHWQRVSDHFDLLLDRPEAVDALEQTILQLAVRGLLVPQDPADEPASVLLQKIRAEKDRLIANRDIRQDRESAATPNEGNVLNIPSGWKRVKFGEFIIELCTGPFGSVIHKGDYIKDGVPLINPSHMKNGQIEHDPEISVSREMAIDLNAYKLHAGDIVLARRGEVGRYALVTEFEAGWICGTGSFFVKLHRDCDRKYIGLMLEDPAFRKKLLGESVGSTMVNLNQRILLDSAIVIPPLAEQTRIVARVTELRHLCTALRQRLAARQTTQRQLAEALVEV